MFDGKTGSARNVDLGGRRRDRDREEFLNKMAKQRGERAEERLKRSSSTRIQRNFRGYQVRKAIFGTWAQELDKKLADINKLGAIIAAAGKPFSVPLDVRKFYHINLIK
jgi:hypothetical protein